jgi:hypothetical protein
MTSPAPTRWPTRTWAGLTCRNTQTLPSWPCTFTVPPKTWPVLPDDGRTSTTVPSIGLRTVVPAGANQSLAAW